MDCKINPLSANPTKWSNTLKQFVDSLLVDSALRLAFVLSRYIAAMQL